MSGASRADLHAHSTASDGQRGPAELVAAAAAVGLSAVALTDHDTTDGWAQAAAALPAGLALVRGVEVSCTAREEEGPPTPLHLLVYLPDPEHAGLARLLSVTREARHGRGRAMVAALAAAGHGDLTAVVERLATGVVGRPHVAGALVEVGLAEDLDVAFGPLWLGRGGPFHVPVPAPDAERAVALAREAGGVPVLAHGWAAARGRVLSTGALGRLVAAGLLGVEVRTPHHDVRGRELSAAAAREHGLLETAATDWHGRPDGPALGDVTCGPEVVEALAARASGVPLLRG